MLVSLAQDLDAPLLMAWRNNRGVPVAAISLTGLGLLFAIIMSFLLPNTVYEYLATAAGVMLILNWIIILLSNIKLHPHHAFRHSSININLTSGAFSSYLTVALIVLISLGLPFISVSGSGFYPASPWLWSFHQRSHQGSGRCNCRTDSSAQALSG